MPELDSTPEPWRSFLRELDGLITAPVSLHCIGGFVVTMLYGLSRPTADIDFIEIAPRTAWQAIREIAGPGGELHLKYGIYLELVTVAQPPINYESRLIEMFPCGLTNLYLMALDPYDLALTKLQRNGTRDRDDVRFLAKETVFDLNVFRDRYENELRSYVTNPDRDDLTMELWIEIIEEDRQAAREHS